MISVLIMLIILKVKDLEKNVKKSKKVYCGQASASDFTIHKDII